MPVRAWGQRDVWKGHGCKWGMAGGMFHSAAHLDHRLLDSCPLGDSIRVWIDVGLAALQRPVSPRAMEILTKVQVHSTLAIPVQTQPPRWPPPFTALHAFLSTFSLHPSPHCSRHSPVMALAPPLYIRPSPWLVTAPSAE